MSARGLSRVVLVAVCVVAGVVGVWVGSASAAFTGYSFVDAFGVGGVGVGSFGGVGSVAVEQSSGDVLVLDAGTGSLYRFDAAGEPVEFPAVKGDVIEGVGGAGGGFSEIAVDNSAGPARGDIYVANEGGLLVFNEAGERLGELTEGAGAPWGVPCGVAVDGAGRVYVGLLGFPGYVNEYAPSGSPVVDGDYVASLWGVPLTCGVAAGVEGDVYGSGFTPVGALAGVTRYAVSQFNTKGQTAGGTLLDAAASTLATDPLSGDVFADEHLEEGAAGQLVHYGSAAVGSPRLEVFGGKGQPGELTGGSYGVAVNDVTGTVYAAQGAGMVDVFAAKIVPDVVTGPPSRLVGEAATLTGTVNPDGTTLSSCEFEYGTAAGVYPDKAECSPVAGSITGTKPVAVTAHIAGLEQGVLYHFRLSAGNSEGTGYGLDQLVDVPPIVEGESVLDVSGDSATLQAQINPDWSPTTYHFEYGTGESYGTSVPVPAAEIAASGSGVPVSVHVQGLAAGTVYHYRVVAGNEVGASSGSDHTLTTQPVGGEFALPDERQFELVSPANKHGGEVLPLGSVGDGGMAQTSEAGDAVTYMSYVPFEANAPANSLSQQFVSERGATGWTTQNISAPVSGIAEATPDAGAEYKAFSLDLSRGIEDPFELPIGSAGEGENGERRLSPEQPKEFHDIFMWDQGIVGFQPLVTSAAPDTQNEKGIKQPEVEFVGAAPDLKHVVFASERALTNNAQRTRPSSRNLYEWADGAFQLVNVLPDGQATIREENGGSTALRLGALEAEDVRNAVSDDGSRVIWSYQSHVNEHISPLHIYESNMSTGKSVQVDASQGGPGA